MITAEERDFFIKQVLYIKDRDISNKELEVLIFPKKDHKIVRVLGKGSGGIVFDVKSLKTKKHFALKAIGISKGVDFAMSEFNFQNHLAEYKLAPKVYKTQLIQSIFKGYTIKFVLGIMDIIYCTVNDYIEYGGNPKNLIPAFECLLKKKAILEFETSKNKKDTLMHGDMHTGNIIILGDKKTLGFLDFGYSILKPIIFQILDAIPLITSIKYDSRNYDNEGFAKSIINIYKDLFNINMDYKNFKPHPTGGYMYVTSQNNFLHSYNWEENIGMMRFKLPTANDIRRAFPTLKLPKII